MLKNLFLFFLSFQAIAADKCNFENMKVSHMPFDLKNTGYNKLVLGFSYGPEISTFLPKLKSADSNYYYLFSKDEPIVTFIITRYESETVAKEAFAHLEKKYSLEPGKAVRRKGNAVVWFGTGGYDLTCFKQIVEKEFKKLP